MGKLKLFFKYGALMALTASIFICAASAEETTYTIRGDVYDNSKGDFSGDFHWDADSFTGFWYQVKQGLSSEILYLKNENKDEPFSLNDELKEGNLLYISKPQIKKTKIGGITDEKNLIVDGFDLKMYYLLGFFGIQHVAMLDKKEDSYSGAIPEKIAKILKETGSDKITKKTGESYSIAKDWSLYINEIDADGKKVRLDLKKGDKTVETQCISASPGNKIEERIFLLKDEDDYPLFYCHVDNVFKADTDYVVFNYVYLREEITELDGEDKFGILKIDGFEIPDELDGFDYAGSGKETVLKAGDKAIVMKNDKNLKLAPKKKIDIYDRMYIKTEDTKGKALKMSLYKIMTAKTAPSKATESVLPKETEINPPENKNNQSPPSTESINQTPSQTQKNDEQKSKKNVPGFELATTAAVLVGVLHSMRRRK